MPGTGETKQLASWTHGRGYDQAPLYLDSQDHDIVLLGRIPEEHLLDPGRGLFDGFLPHGVAGVDQLPFSFLVRMDFLAFFDQSVGVQVEPVSRSVQAPSAVASNVSV